MKTIVKIFLSTIVLIVCASAGNIVHAQPLAEGSNKQEKKQMTETNSLPDAKTGEALAADGGEPGKAFLAFIAAIHKKDIAAVREMIPPGDRSPKDEKELGFFAMMTPTDPKIEKGYVKNDLAVLYVSGTMENEKTWGTIEMFKKDGRWWQRHAKWSNKPPMTEAEYQLLVKQSAGTATGILKIDEKPLQLSHAYAMSQPNVFHKERNDVAVLLTSTPIPADAFQGKEDISYFVSGQGWAIFKLDVWALFKFDDKGNLISETIDHPSLGGGRLNGSGDDLYTKFVAKNLGKDSIGGSFETEKVEKWSNHRYEIKVSFEAPIMQPKRHDPLPDAKMSPGSSR